MISNQKPTGRSASIPAGLAFGALVSTAVSMLIALVLCKLVDLEKMQWENIGYGVMAMLLISSFLGSGAAYAKIKRQRAVVSLLSALVYFGILLSVTALLFGGQYEAVGVTAILIFAGSGAAGFMRLGEKKSGNRKKTKYHYR